MRQGWVLGSTTVGSCVAEFPRTSVFLLDCRPVTQFPFGWAPSEVFYNVPSLGDTPLK